MIKSVIYIGMIKSVIYVGMIKSVIYVGMIKSVIYVGMIKFGISFCNQNHCFLLFSTSYFKLF